jgi:(R,R)-butanediol dehydrogenase / meso-butanediol dehydrogenase / diacetyl reductase
MKAAVFTDIETLEIQEKDIPRAEPGQAVVKIERCGICGSDLHGYGHGTMYGVFYSPGVVMGHECSGVVAEVGEGVEDINVGDRVVIQPNGPCQTCDACLAGKSSLCANLISYVIGLTPAYDGAFAEYALVPKAAQMLLKLPDNVSFEEGALVEPLAVSLHGVRQSRFKPGDSTLVLGAGPIGLGVIQFLKLGGAGRIIVLEVSPERSALAREMGADVILNPQQDGEDAMMMEFHDLTGGLGVDVVYECVGVPWSFQNALNFMKPGGQVMILGVTMDPTPIDPAMFILKETEMKGCFGSTPLEFKMTLDLLAQKKINTRLLVTETIALEDIQEKGFQRLLKKKDAIKIMVKP